MFGGEAGFAALGAGAVLPTAGLPAAGGVVEVGLAPVAAGAAVLLAAGERIRMASSRLVVPSRTRSNADSCMPGNLCRRREELYALFKSPLARNTRASSSTTKTSLIII